MVPVIALCYLKAGHIFQMAFRLTLSTQGSEAVGEKEAEAAFVAVEQAFADLGATLRK